jgi:hypothetical protein
MTVPSLRCTLLVSAQAECTSSVVAVSPRRSLPLSGSDLHGDGQPIRIGRRVPFAGSVFDQTDIAGDKGVRASIGETDDRPAHKPYLPAPEGGRDENPESAPVAFPAR